MVSKQKNSTMLNIGGAERTLKFGMNTQERYLFEIAKMPNPDNYFTQKKLIIYCGLLIGEKDKLPPDFSLEMLGDWIDECEDDRFDEVNQMAGEAMGFILSAEQSTFDRQIQKMKVVAPKEFEKMMQTILETPLAQS